MTGSERAAVGRLPASLSASRFLRLVLGDDAGTVCTGWGIEPHWNERGRYVFERMVGRQWDWPRESDELVATAAKVSDSGGDAYVCLALRPPGWSRRRKGEATGPLASWVDLDGPPEDRELYDALHPLRVCSGSPGHEHVIVLLAEPFATLAEWERAQTTLRDRLGGDAKIADNDLMRLPGTLNHKHEPPRAVRVVEWSTYRWPPGELAEVLGVDLCQVPRERKPSRAKVRRAANRAVERGTLPELANEPPFDELDLDYNPGVERAWHNTIKRPDGSEDRSGELHGLVKAAKRAGYSVERTAALCARYAPGRDKWPSWDEIATEVERSWTSPDDDETAQDDAEPERFIEWASFWAEERREAAWIVAPVIEEGQSVAIFSPAKIGKSLLALEIAAAKATGQAVLDTDTGEPIDVLYVDHENTVDDLRDRLESLGYGPDDDLSRLHYSCLGDWPPLDEADGGKALLDAVRATGARLVVIDSLSRAVEGHENDADTIRALYRHSLRPLKSERVAVIRLDNTGKDERKGQRGSSAKNDDIDVAWSLTARSGDMLTLRRVFSRRRPAGPDVLFLQRSGQPLRHGIVRDFGGDDSHEQAVEHVMHLLEQLDLPIAAGRQKARAALNRAGHSARNDVLGEALRRRKLLSAGL